MWEDLDPQTRENIRRAHDPFDPRLLGDPVRDFALPFWNVGSLVARRATERPEREFLTFADNEAGEPVISRLTYRALGERVAKAIGLFHELGLRRGDTISTADLFNHADTVVLLLAAWGSGIRVAPLNMEEDPERLSFILGNARAKALFVRASHLPILAPIAEGLKIPRVLRLGGGDRNVEDYAAREAAARPRAPDESLPLSNETLLVYTSGTTGKPKGVLQAQAMLYDVDGIVAFHSFTERDVFLTAMRLFHVNAIGSLLAALWAGARLVLMRRWNPRQFWRLCQAEGVTTSSVVPAMLSDLLRVGEDVGTAYPGLRERLRAVFCGAGTLKISLARRFLEETGVRITHGWGMSETTCWACWLPHDLDPADYRRLMLDFEAPSIGHPMRHARMGIFSSEGKPLPAGEKGEIVLAGRIVMERYVERPEANRDTFQWGVLETGDEGFWAPDARGRPMFFITGRLKDLIERGGEKYSPYEMDEILARIPGVASGLVYGFASERLGQEVGAVFELEPGSRLDLEAVQRHCKAAGWTWSKTPKEIRIVEKIPKTATGKDTRKMFGDVFRGLEKNHYPKPGWF